MGPKLPAAPDAQTPMGHESSVRRGNENANTARYVLGKRWRHVQLRMMTEMLLWRHGSERRICQNMMNLWPGIDRGFSQVPGSGMHSHFTWCALAGSAARGAVSVSGHFGNRALARAHWRMF
jgi:hypothetical protein